MRFVRLDLERYGPFTDCSIPLREDARLHLVYGRNEAGKSTALSAITDLLFGFPQRGAQDFLHRLPDLRVGARIIDRSGKAVEFRRRRGNVRTLITADETALPDDLLKACLGGMTRDVFTRAFGLSTEGLREGGEDMLKEKGDIGSALFAAASGLHGPSRLRRALEAEAERIFDVKRAGHRSFYQALDRYQTARKAEGELRLRAGDWRELNARIEALAGEQAEIDAERVRLSGEGARLARLKRLAPLMRLADEAVRELDGLDVAAPPAGFAEKLRTALAAEARAAQQREDGAEALEALRRELDGIKVDEPLLGRTNEIAALFAESGQYAKAKLDLPGVDREAQGLRHEVDTLARRLGLGETAELEQRLPRDADLALTRSLCKEGRALEAEIESLRASLARESQACAALEREQAAHGAAAIDPEPLRERLIEIGPVLRRLQQRTELEREIKLEERAIAEAALRLDPKIEALDAIAVASLPSAETLARFRKELDAAGRALERANEEAQSAERACVEIEAALEKLAAGRAVPTAEAVAAERAGRAAAWAPLRAALFGAELPPEERARGVAAFELRIAEADRLADEALGDAKRVAQHGAQLKNLEAERRRQAKARAALAEAAARDEALAADWGAAWAAAKLAPLPPAEMVSWSAALAVLLERRARLEARRESWRALETEERSILGALREIARTAGLEAEESAPGLQIAARLETRIRRLSEAWEAARGLVARIGAARERVEQNHAMLKDASSRKEDWSERWRKALPRLGLPAEATLDEADAILQAWGEAPERMRLVAKEERRILGMRRDNADFEERARKLFGEVAKDLLGAPVQTAAHTLNERAAAAARGAALRADCAARLAAAAERAQTAEAAHGAARAKLGTLGTEIEGGAAEDLQALLERLDRRLEALEAALRRRHEELLRAADGLDEEAIRAELTDFDASVAEERLLAFAADDKRLVERSREVYAARQEASKMRGELEAGTGAELAAQLRRNAESELAQEARRWAVLKLGALLVGKAIERHRQAAQNPLMSRAAHLFAGLTAGAFAGLGSRVDADDMPALVGQRADGSYVGIDGMSEGTRDQLYLALRLAYVESYAASSEPPPFIADDIFVTFDDERTERGLEALAEIGEKVQCVLFTHHRRNVEIARERLGGKVDIIEL